MLKKYLLTAVALGAMALCSVCSAEINVKEARLIAQKEVPTNAVMYGIDQKGKNIIANFRDNEAFRDYDVEVDADTGAVYRVIIGGSNIVGSTNIVKTPGDITAIVLEHYPDAVGLNVQQVKEGNNTVYVAEFSNPKYMKATIKLNPVTGAIGRQELIYR